MEQKERKLKIQRDLNIRSGSTQLERVIAFSGSKESNTRKNTEDKFKVCLSCGKPLLKKDGRTKK